MGALWMVDVLLAGTESSSTCTLLTADGHRVIVDTGLSAQEAELLHALDVRGLVPADIDAVINTHLHVDHCGNNSIFPNATVFMSQHEWEWTDAFYGAIFNSDTPETAMATFYPQLASHGLKTRTIRNFARLAKMFWDPARLGREGQRRWLETAPLPEGLQLLASPGHTPHHVSIRVAAGEPVIVAGDAVLTEVDGAAVTTMIPFSREQFAATRHALLNHGYRIVPGHGAAFVPQTGSVTLESPRTPPDAMRPAARTFPR